MPTFRYEITIKEEKYINNYINNYFNCQERIRELLKNIDINSELPTNCNRKNNLIFTFASIMDLQGANLVESTIYYYLGAKAEKYTVVYNTLEVKVFRGNIFVTKVIFDSNPNLRIEDYVKKYLFSAQVEGLDYIIKYINKEEEDCLLTLQLNKTIKVPYSLVHNQIELLKFLKDNVRLENPTIRAYSTEYSPMCSAGRILNIEIKD